MTTSETINTVDIENRRPALSQYLNKEDYEKALAEYEASLKSEPRTAIISEGATTLPAGENNAPVK